MLNLRKLIRVEAEREEQHCVEVQKRFTALNSLDAGTVSESASQTIKKYQNFGQRGYRLLRKEA
jgi:hypothetical protein